MEKKNRFVAMFLVLFLLFIPQLIFSQDANFPNSKFHGVQIGTITYSFRSMPGSAEEILTYCVDSGLSSIELMGEPVEAYAGAPQMERPQWTRGQRPTEEQRAEFQKKREEFSAKIKEWRASVSMEKFKELRKMYNDAGVEIHIVKFGGIGPNMSNEENEYFFKVAKVMGAKGITTEISDEKAKFLAPLADKHEIYVGFHNHTQVNATSWDEIFTYGKYLAMNLDVGHFVAGTNESPIPLIEKYAKEGRILSIHIKDRKVSEGQNMPLGHGDTPLGLILQLMKRNQYTFPADIELEYKIPEGSDAVAEMKKCVEFCEKALADPPKREERRMR